MSDADAQETLVLREISASDASACVTLSRAVGWPHRIEDWEMVIGLGHGVVATLGGEIVATALWWPYGEMHATLGMIIVSPEHQGAGIGKRLMQGLFEQTKSRSLMLNATAAGEPLYARWGFVPCGGVSQYHGDALAVAAPSLRAGAILRAGAMLRPGAAADLPELERLDRGASGLPRRAVLTALLERGECVILERDGKAIGFSILRRFGRGLVVGPVVAPDEADAEALIAHWLHERQGQFVRVDIPVGSNLGDWLVERGLKPAGTVTAMVRGERPVVAGSARLYALINQALG
jgi:GNAT superfamily N-acetyltransferase